MLETVHVGDLRNHKHKVVSNIAVANLQLFVTIELIFLKSDFMLRLYAEYML